MEVHPQSHRLIRIENFHILLWLLKDSAWLMEYKLLGVLMIFPTVAVALWLVIKTIKYEAFYINVAVLFWILANANWMLDEFFTTGFKHASLYLFMLGLMAACISFTKNLFEPSK